MASPHYAAPPEEWGIQQAGTAVNQYLVDTSATTLAGASMETSIHRICGTGSSSIQDSWIRSTELYMERRGTVQQRAVERMWLDPG